jgi:hypothetical protein
MIYPKPEEEQKLVDCLNASKEFIEALYAAEEMAAEMRLETGEEFQMYSEPYHCRLTEDLRTGLLMGVMPLMEEWSIKLLSIAECPTEESFEEFKADTLAHLTKLYEEGWDKFDELWLASQYEVVTPASTDGEVSRSR